jgi:hypothetical protein
MNKTRALPFVSLTLLLPAAAFSQSSATTTLAVSVAAEATLSVSNSSTSLTTSSIFGNYTGATNLTWKIRTSAGNGTGSITAKVTTDFNGINGPSVANSAATGDTLSYTCAADSPATACSGAQTASTTAATSVASFGAAASSKKGGSSATVNWSLVDDPAYAPGSYAATVTFTISAS